MCTGRLSLCRVRPVHIASAVFCGTMYVYKSLVFWSHRYTSQLLCFVGLWTCIDFCRRTVCIWKIKAACAEPVCARPSRIRSRVDPAFGAQAGQRRERAGSGPGAWARAVSSRPESTGHGGTGHNAQWAGNRQSQTMTSIYEAEFKYAEKGLGC